jgi:hypothetical protein
VNLPFITADQNGPKHLAIKLSRAKLEALVNDLIERTVGPCKAALKDAGLQASDINEVVLPSPHLNRRQRSLWAAADAEAIGYGGCVLLSRVTGLSVQTIATRRIKLRLTNTRGDRIII